VAHWIEVLPFFQHAPVIDGRHQESLLRGSRRNHPFSIRTEHARTTIGQDVRARIGNHLSPRGAGADILAAHQSRDRQDIRPRLQSDEAGDVAGIAASARPDCDVQIIALCIQSCAREGHPVFPAIQSARMKSAKPVRSQSRAPGAFRRSASAFGAPSRFAIADR
jgi:hypothetical protein